jgi:hypothetical protein
LHSSSSMAVSRVPSPPPPEVNTPVAENWCYTQVGSRSCDGSLSCAGVGSAIDSAVLAVKIRAKVAEPGRAIRFGKWGFRFARARSRATGAGINLRRENVSPRSV